MALAKKTVIDRIEWDKGGGYYVRLGLAVEEGGKELASRWHRFMVWNSGQVDDTCAAVNANLADLGADTLGQNQINRIKNIILAVEGVVGWKDPPPPPPQLLQLIGQTP